MQIIFHLTLKSDWESAQKKGFYEPSSLHTEGFIHCSTETQVAGVLERYYQGVKGLVLLTLNSEMLTSELKFELAPSVNESFPHIYGPINLNAVIEVKAIE